MAISSPLSPSFGPAATNPSLFGAIRPPQALGNSVAIATVDLKAEEVFPLGPTHVERSNLARHRAKYPVGVILERLHIPKVRFHIAAHLGKIVEYPLGQIN